MNHFLQEGNLIYGGIFWTNITQKRLSNRYKIKIRRNTT